MPFDVNHPNCILKIILYASQSPVEPFSTYEQVSPEWFDVVEPHAASAVIQNLKINKLGSQRVHHRRGPVGFLRESNTVTPTFDCRPFRTCTTIMSSFLIRSTGITFIDLSGRTLENVREIRSFFLFRLRNLRKVNLSSLMNVESIGCYFLGDNSNLSEVIFHQNVEQGNDDDDDDDDEAARKQKKPMAFSKLKVIGESFLRGNSSLTTLDMSSFVSVEKVESQFLYQCKALKKVIGLKESVLKTPSKIGTGFMAYCSSLEKIDLSSPAFGNLTKDFNAGGWFQSCDSLMELDLSGLTKNQHKGVQDGDVENLKIWEACQEYRRRYSLSDPEDYRGQPIHLSDKILSQMTKLKLPGEEDDAATMNQERSNSDEKEQKLVRGQDLVRREIISKEVFQKWKELLLLGEEEEK